MLQLCKRYRVNAPPKLFFDKVGVREEMRLAEDHRIHNSIDGEIWKGVLCVFSLSTPLPQWIKQGGGVEESGNDLDVKFRFSLCMPHFGQAG